jgi:TIR domain
LDGYNLLMVGHEGYWDGSPAEFSIARIFEYTEEVISERYLDKNGKVLPTLFNLPCLFCYEFPTGADARVGRVTRVDYSGNDVVIHFEFDQTLPPIPMELIEKLAWELQIEKLEKYRTHWAVKKGNLYDILAIGGIVKITDEVEVRIKSISDLLSGVVEDPKKQPASEPAQRVFISYSHRDAEYLDRLKVHFKGARRKFELSVWEDTQIQTGQRWKDEIERELNGCSVAILLVSADFLASDFISQTELPVVLQRAHNSGVRVVPIIIKPCMFEEFHELSAFQAINGPNAPLAGMAETDREAVYTRVVRTALLIH